MATQLQQEIDNQGQANASAIGPSPAYIEKIRGRYRWVVTLRSPDPASILSHISMPSGWSVDIDPVGLT
jgi:primosomal protein N' (replication factor Y)